MRPEIAKGIIIISAPTAVKALITIPKVGPIIPIMAVAVFFNIPSTSMSGNSNFRPSLLAYYLICFIRLF